MIQKISNLISRCNSDLKSSISKFNKIQTELLESDPDFNFSNLNIYILKDRNSKFWNNHPYHHQDVPFSSSIQRECIDLFCQKKRAEEELKFTTVEIRSLLLWEMRLMKKILERVHVIRQQIDNNEKHWISVLLQKYEDLNSMFHNHRNVLLRAVNNCEYLDTENFEEFLADLDRYFNN